jgi:hypothetical protein
MRRQSLQIPVYPAIFIGFWLFLLLVAISRGEDCNCRPVECNDDDSGSSWIFMQGRYTHSPETGKRVTQYAPLPTVYAPYDPTYRESAFHYTQEIIRGPNGSIDALHMTQSWGREQVRPYGEWQYPYRAGATPYGPWGNPQGPWTLPFDSWQNPYGLGRLRWPVYPNPYPPYPTPIPYGNYNTPQPNGNDNSPPPQPGTGFDPSPEPYNVP